MWVLGIKTEIPVLAMEADTLLRQLPSPTPYPLLIYLTGRNAMNSVEGSTLKKRKKVHFTKRNHDSNYKQEELLKEVLYTPWKSHFDNKASPISNHICSGKALSTLFL